MKSKEWYLLYCKSQDAERIKWRVSQLGVDPFYPQYVKITVRKDCKSVRKEEKPLFPNYLFLSFDITKTHTSDITSLPGAVGFVRFCDKPCLVPDKVVSAIECARMLAIDEEAIEYRNVSPELIEKIQEISQIRSTTTRQVLFSKLLETNTL